MQLLLAVLIVAGGIVFGQPVCRFSTFPNVIDVPAEGGTYTVVNAGGGVSFSNCLWFPSSDVDWISSGRGTIIVGANPDPARREGVAKQAVTVQIRQAAGTGRCTAPMLAATRWDAPADGGTRAVTIQADAACVWVIRTAVDEGLNLSLLYAKDASGRNILTANLRPNSRPAARTGTIFIGGAAFEVNQAAQVCDFTPSAGILSLSALGGRDRLEVPTYCSWELRPEVDSPWISFRKSPGILTQSVETNTGQNATSAAREKVVTVADKPLTIWQAPAGCSYQLIPSNLSIPSGGGEVTLYINTHAACPWKLQLPQWLQPMLSAQGNGAQSIRLRASAATGAGRAQPIILAGIATDVSQQGPDCPIQVTEGVRKTDNFGSVELIVQTACQWVLRTDRKSIETFDPDIGEGPARVTIKFENSGNAARSSAWVAIGSELRRFAVPPDNCRPRFGIETHYVSGSGERIELGIGGLLAFGCEFSLAADSPWIHVSQTSARPGQVPKYQLETDPNRTGAPRTGRVMIADQKLVISQAALRVSITSISGLVSQSIAPGLVFSAEGGDLGPITGGSGFDAAGTRVLVGGRPAYILSVSPGSIKAIAPFGIPTAGKVPVRVVAWGIESNSVEINRAAAAPRKEGDIVIASTFPAGSNEALGPGDVISIFLTGAGQTVPPSVDGEIYGPAAPSLAAQVEANLSDRPIEVLYAGGAPGQIAGVSQINLRIPPDYIPEPSPLFPGAGFVNVSLTIRFDGKELISERLAIKTTAALPLPK